MKRIIIIVSVILVISLLALVGYYFLTRSSVDSTGKPTGFRSFFPFGGNDLPPTEETPTNTEETPATNEPEGIKNFTQKLRKLSDEPVAGAGTQDVTAGTVVRYIEKATGHIFEVELFSPRADRISNTTIPKVYDAVWGGKNNSLVTRYLKEDNLSVDTYYLTLKNTSTSSENTITGQLLPSNISDVSGFGDYIFYLVQNSDSSVGISQGFDLSKKKQIWSSNIKELNSQYVNVKTVSLTTKPAENIPGFMYFIDTTTGTTKRVLGGIMGLSTLSDSSGDNVLYLEQNDAARMYIYNIKTKTSTGFSPVTFPEKCVWSKKETGVFYCAVPKEYLGSGSLTSWYRGTVSFSDDIWKYDTKTNAATTIENLEADSDTKIDVIKPTLSENEQYLVFINKVDNKLWSLDLTK